MCFKLFVGKIKKKNLNADDYVRFDDDAYRGLTSYMLLAAGLSRLGRNGWGFVDTSRLIGTNNEYYRGSMESMNA